MNATKITARMANAGDAREVRAMSPPLQDQVQSAAVVLLQRQAELRGLATSAEIAYFAANGCMDVLRAQQIVVFERGRGRTLRVRAVSSLSSIDRTAPLIRMFEEISRSVDRQGSIDKPRDFNAAALVREQSDALAAYPLREMQWLPWLDRRQRVVGGMLLARAAPWGEQDAKIARYFADAVAHAWAALGDRRAWRILQLKPMHLVVLLGLLPASLLLLPVPMTVLAPAEVAPRDPFVVASGIDGVVKSVDVEPNAPVKAGQLLLTLSDTVLRNRAEVAEREVVVAETRYKKAAQLAFVDVRGRHDMAIAQSELDLKRAERDYARELLARAEVRADRDGVAFFADKRDLVGRPVVTGEKLMEVADPAASDFRIDLPVGDAIVLQSGARVRVFLDADPLNTLEATLISAAYKAGQRDGQVLAFRLIARSVERLSSLRLGARGTAQIFGDRVPLGLYLFRRPISALRQWAGL